MTKLERRPPSPLKFNPLWIEDEDVVNVIKEN
jgi:hypothetical protein